MVKVRLSQAIVAGFWATVALSAMMLVKQMMGIMLDVNPVMDLALLYANATNSTPNVLIGWLMHFVLGTLIWGIAYALLSPHFPGGHLIRGLIFGVLAWLAMMLIFMPYVGHGFFAMGYHEGFMPAMATLMLHLVYGAVLGKVYGHLTAKSAK
ncbi:DUF6789 family protein [Vibrio sp. DNB22_12_1]